MKLNKKLHTLNEGIPAIEKETQVGMDTKNQRKGIHLWISKEIDIAQEIKNLQIELKERKKMLRILSIHLTKKDAKNLIEEINYRIF